MQDFFLSKLEAYGFSFEALKVMHNYLTDGKHRTKRNDSFSDYIDLLQGVTQSQLLGVFFVHHLHLQSLLFCRGKDVTSYADDKFPYSNVKNAVLENTETKEKEVFNWFSINYLKANLDKSQLLLTSKGEAFIKIDKTDIKTISYKTLLGVLVYNRLTLLKYF